MKNDHATRLCKKCNSIFPLNTFPKYGGDNGGRRHECHDCYRARMTEHYVANREHRKRAARINYAKNPAAHWTPERRARANELARKRNTELRTKVYAMYGGACVCCGDAEPLFLTLDHIDNNGKMMRKEVHGKASLNLYNWVVKNNYPKVLQLLCMNCNFGKSRNGGTCPHH